VRQGWTGSRGSEIITALSRIRWLFVTARNSGFTYMTRRVRALEFSPHTEGKEADGVTPIATLSRAEIEDAIRALSPVDWARLRLVAARYASGRRLDAKDLLQEALLRSLDGRNCPRHVDVVRFLAEAMRSIADGESEKVANRLVVVSADRTSIIAERVQNHPTPDLSAEESLIARSVLVEYLAERPQLVAASGAACCPP
jgi:hypothetical protein